MSRKKYIQEICISEIDLKNGKSRNRGKKDGSENGILPVPHLPVGRTQ